MTGPLRPLTPEDREHAALLGAELRRLRLAAGGTQRTVALAAELSRRQLQYLEAGHRRTRASTLQRLASVLVPAPDDAATYARLVAVAGPALAAESPYAPRVARRRQQRSQRALARQRQALRQLAQRRAAAVGRPVSAAELYLEHMRQLDAMPKRTPAQLQAVQRHLDAAPWRLADAAGR